MNINVINFVDLKKKKLKELSELCSEFKIECVTNRETMIFELMKCYFQKKYTIIYLGLLEVINNSYGFLRDLDRNFIPCICDVYVHRKFLKEAVLRIGDMVECNVIAPKNDEQKIFALSNVLKVNGSSVKKYRKYYDDFTSIYPTQQIKLEIDNATKKEEEYSVITRFIDLIATIGKGQRALVASPPKSGKTTILHSIAYSILVNHPNIKLIIVLVGERPEEVTEMKKIAPNAEIVFSTFDDPPENHIKTAELINERAKRLVEDGHDVIILLDSITRLVRSYNYVVPSSGRVLTGGVEPASLYKPKRFFGSARNTEEGGSLTIIATALVETGSKMDDFIYEDLKGTGNSEIILSRNISEQKIFPAIDIKKSGTRRFEQMLPSDMVSKLRLIMRFLSNMEPTESTKFLIERIKTTKNNRELIVCLQR